MAGILLLALASCERNEGPQPGDQPQEEGKQGLISTGEPQKPGKPEPDKPPEKKEEPPVLVEKKAPVAEPAPGQPGKVISPFNGQLIDVSGIAPGTLVADPTYPPEAKKHFRVPEMPETAKPPTILDPAILIRPGGTASESPAPAEKEE